MTMKEKKRKYTYDSYDRSRNRKGNARNKFSRKPKIIDNRYSDDFNRNTRTSLIRNKLKKSGDEKTTTAASMLKMKMATHLKQRLSVAVRKDQSLTDTVQIAQKLQRKYREKLSHTKKHITYQKRIEEQIKTANTRTVVMHAMEENDMIEKVLDFKKKILEQQNHLKTKEDASHFDAIFGKPKINDQNILKQSTEKDTTCIQNKKIKNNWKKRVQEMRIRNMQKEFFSKTNKQDGNNYSSPDN